MARRKKKSEPQGLVYVGGDTYYIQGVPARDLTPEEVEKHGGAERLLAYANVYERPPEKPVVEEEAVEEPAEEVSEETPPEEISSDEEEKET